MKMQWKQQLYFKPKEHICLSQMLISLGFSFWQLQFIFKAMDNTCSIFYRPLLFTTLTFFSLSHPGEVVLGRIRKTACKNGDQSNSNITCTL